MIPPLSESGNGRIVSFGRDLDIYMSDEHLCRDVARVREMSMPNTPIDWKPRIPHYLANIYARPLLRCLRSPSYSRPRSTPCRR